MSEAYELFQEGRERLRRGRAAQATVPLERAKRLEPDKASIREALGIAYFRLRRWREAEAEFRAVLELSPTRRLRPLRARPRARAAGPRRGGKRPLQARERRWPRRASTTPPGSAETVRAVIQRVAVARAEPGGAIGPGLLVLLGVARTDDDEAAARLAAQVARLRIFAGTGDRLDRSLLDTGGEALVVSQFTLVASERQKGTRPDFSQAARARAGRAALRALLRGAPRARCPDGNRRLRGPDGRRARQRRPGHDRARPLSRRPARRGGNWPLDRRPGIA